MLNVHIHEYAISFKANQHGRTTSLHLALFFLFSRPFDMDASSLFLLPLVLLSYLKIVLDGENEAKDPVVQPRRASRLIQLVGVSSSSGHSGEHIWFERWDGTGSCYLKTPVSAAQNIWFVHLHFCFPNIQMTQLAVAWQKLKIHWSCIATLLTH